MASLQRMASLLSCILLCIALTGPVLTESKPAKSESKLKKAARAISRKLEMLKKSGRAAVIGCGPEVVGEECQQLVDAYYSLPKYPCTTRYGDFPVPQQPRKFFRCRGDILTLEDCGKKYVFDSKASYCVLEKRRPTKRKNAVSRGSKSNSTEDAANPSVVAAANAVCPRGFFSPLLDVSADVDLLKECKDKLCEHGAKKISLLRRNHCRKREVEHSAPSAYMVTRRKVVSVASTVNSIMTEARLWWVADIPLELAWRSAGLVTSLQDCLTSCKDRFVIAGTSTCACGSVSEEHPNFNISRFVEEQNAKEIEVNHGFLLYDREAFKTAVGWTCVAQPVGWTRQPAKGMATCLVICAKTKAPYSAFGRTGCYCSPQSPEDGVPLTQLPRDHCRKLNRKGYNVLDNNYWNKAINKYVTLCEYVP
ncbi:uncharacterized protein LOC122365396 [Amphibalanus amphitrite]|uniref:uncharacterized protein LOC122365396 n=1 Tax=Amphibalanus amphitrite TaxID=1232801 RepID=UPI001C9019E7|nr:uncharacterized protein LOC122365396 [Amphibalanus amphitrite]